jgi:hypothetical protein
MYITCNATNPFSLRDTFVCLDAIQVCYDLVLKYSPYCYTTGLSCGWDTASMVGETGRVDDNPIPVLSKPASVLRNNS